MDGAWKGGGPDPASRPDAVAIIEAALNRETAEKVLAARQMELERAADRGHDSVAMLSQVRGGVGLYAAIAAQKM